MKAATIASLETKEKAQNYLKDSNNRNAALARENDKLRAENERWRLRSFVPAASGEELRPMRPMLAGSQ